jgi:hypothetical protein
MATTIQVSEELRDELKSRKLYSKESFEDVIWDLLEDVMEISEEFKKELDEAHKEIERGEYVSFEDAKKELGL